MTNSKSRAILELSSILGFFLAVKFFLTDINLGFFTPGAISIIGSLGIIWFFQIKNGGGLAELGLNKPDSWKRFIFTAVVTFILVAVIGIFGIPLLQSFLGEFPQDLNPVSFPLFLVWARVMFTAAFGEEVVFRGFMLPRLEVLFANWKFATVLAVILQAVIFGLLHYSSGLVVVISAGVIGLVFGIAFIFGKRNLWPLILVHAIPDTISLFQG